MQLTLIRTYYTTSTEGELYIDGEFFCNTLERPLKQYDKVCKGCIPEGIYEVELTMSPRFKRVLPLLKSVPNFEGIRIHGGNTVNGIISTKYLEIKKDFPILTSDDIIEVI